MENSSRRKLRTTHHFKDGMESVYERKRHAAFRTVGKTKRTRLLNLIKLLTILFVPCAFILPIVSKGSDAGVFFALNRANSSVISFGFFILTANILYMIWQMILAIGYREVPSAEDSDLPALTVIVPCFNEGKQIHSTLLSILRSDYPPEKLDIIAVNDGSCDDTLFWMRKAEAESSRAIRVIDLPHNTGKRNAIYQGVLVSDSEIFATVDSDSELLPDTLRKLVSPFVFDRKVGGVAGNIRVLNLNDGLIPHMLDVSFVFGFEFTRAAQSVIRTVLCTPGALSAYRRVVLLPVLPGWVNEKFLGKPANIGEDRAISNLVMKLGYDVVFQRNSVAFTKVPTTYAGLCRMFIRWARSNFRENFSMLSFAFGKFTWNWTGLQINLLMQFVWMFTPLLFIAVSVWGIVSNAPAFFYSVVTVVTLWSTIPAFFYAYRYGKEESLWSYVYGLFNFLALFWIAPYSLVTIRHSGWLTREKGNGKEKFFPRTSGVGIK